MAESSVPEKCCTRCGEIKPIERFGLTGWFSLKNGERRRYKTAHCLDCAAEYKRDRRAGRRWEPSPNKTERKCCTCGILKPNSEFQQQRYERGIRFRSECRECGKVRCRNDWQTNSEKRKQKTKIWRTRHRTELLAYDREYRQNNREKWQVYGRRNYANRKGAGFNPGDPSVRDAVAQALELARFGDRYLDAYSGELIDKPTIDHIVPLSKGGTSDVDNLCVTSRRTNASKRDNDLLVWLVKRAKQFHAT